MNTKKTGAPMLPGVKVELDSILVTYNKVSYCIIIIIDSFTKRILGIGHKESEINDTIRASTVATLLLNSEIRCSKVLYELSESLELWEQYNDINTEIYIDKNGALATVNEEGDLELQIILDTYDPFNKLTVIVECAQKIAQFDFNFYGYFQIYLLLSI